MQAELCSFSGLCNMFRRFVSHFARITAPLNRMLRRDQPESFRPLDETEIAAVASLEKALVGQPVPTMPRSKGGYTLETNAFK